MSFGQNLLFFRKMHKGMTQEELAERMGVSRQTVSKWEMDAAFPEMEKVIQLSRLFACSLDDLLLKNLNVEHEAYSDIRVETLPAIHYLRYAVISCEPEEDALRHIREWAAAEGITQPRIIGWDFPFLSQEQINVYHMHGYAAACILPEDKIQSMKQVLYQKARKYAVITIRDPFKAPFTLIPEAYQTLMRYMDINQIKQDKSEGMIACFEETYEKDGVTFMDVNIAAEG